MCLTRFAYQGFTHHYDRRCFNFQGVEERNSIATFCIEIDLPLLLRNRVPVQEGPMFCLHLLTTALIGGPDALGKLHRYRVVDEDFRPLILEREKRAATAALRKPPRRAFRKPPSSSSFHV